MRIVTTCFAILIVAMPALAIAQTSSPSAPDSPEPSMAAGQAAEVGNSQDPAVILKPMRPNSKFDMSLIDDVCKHTKRKTQIYTLKHVAVETVAESINQWLKSKLDVKGAQVNGFICNAPVIIVPDLATNSLIVSVTADFKEMDELGTMIEELDRAPNLIEIKAVLKKTVDGKTKVLANPRLTTLENQPCRVTLDTEDGQFSIELVARMINSEESMNESLRSAENEDDVKSK